MKPTREMVLRQNLKTLKLSTMFTRLEEHIRQASATHQSDEEFLLSLTEVEGPVRAENRLKRRLKEARFPFMKTLETFHFENAVGLDARQIQQLCTCEYISQCQNVIFGGPSGAGKTHGATGLGIEVCQQGFRTRFVTGCGLVNEGVEAQQERVLSRLLKRSAGYDLLVLDEGGYVPFSKAGAELLFQVLAERHERKSMIVTTNLGFADWTQIFGEANLTAALLDRLTHRASIITCAWKSYRLHETLEQSVAKPKKKKRNGSTSPVTGKRQEGGWARTSESRNPGGASVGVGALRKRARQESIASKEGPVIRSAPDLPGFGLLSVNSELLRILGKLFSQSAYRWKEVSERGKSGIETLFYGCGNRHEIGRFDVPRILLWGGWGHQDPDESHTHKELSLMLKCSLSAAMLADVAPITEALNLPEGIRVERRYVERDPHGRRVTTRLPETGLSRKAGWGGRVSRRRRL